MDFDFVYDRKTKQYSVNTEGEFIAVGRFVSTELDASMSVLADFLSWLENTVSGAKTYTEWTVEVDGDDVDVVLNQLLEPLHESQRIERQETTLDWECRSLCGKQDLVKLLRAYISFKQ